MAQSNLLLQAHYKWMKVVANGSSTVYSSGYVTDEDNIALKALVGTYDSTKLIPSQLLTDAKFQIGNTGDSWGSYHPSPSLVTTKNRLWLEFPNNELRKMIGIDPAKVLGIQLIFLVKRGSFQESPLFFTNPSPNLMFSNAGSAGSWDYSGSGTRYLVNKLLDVNPFIQGYFSDSNFNLADISLYDGSGLQTFFQTEMDRATDVSNPNMWSMSNGYSDYTGGSSIGLGNGIVYVDPYSMTKTYASEQLSTQFEWSQQIIRFPSQGSDPFYNYFAMTWDATRVFKNASDQSEEFVLSKVFYPLDIRSSTVNFGSGTPCMSMLVRRWFDGINADPNFVHREGLMFNYENVPQDVYGVTASIVYDGEITQTLPDGTINFAFSNANPSNFVSTDGSASITATATRDDGTAFSTGSQIYMSAGNDKWAINSITYSGNRMTATLELSYIGSASGTPMISGFTLTGHDMTTTTAPATTKAYNGTGTSPSFTVSTENTTKNLVISFINYTGELVGDSYANVNCQASFEFLITREDGSAFPTLPNIGISNGVTHFELSQETLTNMSTVARGIVTFIGSPDNVQRQLTLSASSSSTLGNGTIQNYTGSGTSSPVNVTCPIENVDPLKPSPPAFYDEYAPVTGGASGTIEDPNDDSSAVAPLDVDCSCDGLPMASGEVSSSGCNIGRDYGVFMDSINGVHPERVTRTNRLVPFKAMMSSWLEGTSVEQLYDFLQQYFMTMYRTERDYAFVDEDNNFHQFCNISLFEKLNRLRDLENPIDIEWAYISELAKERGFDFRMFKPEDTASSNNGTFVEDYSASFKKSVRLFVDNLPKIHKTKGTKKGIRGLLGLLGIYIDLKQRYYSVDYDSAKVSVQPPKRISGNNNRSWQIPVCDQEVWQPSKQIFDDSKVKVHATPNIYDFRDEVDVVVDTPELAIGAVGTSLVGVGASGGELDIDLNYKRIHSSPIYDVDLGITEENIADFPQRIVIALSDMDKVRPVNAVFNYADVGIDVGSIMEVVMQDDFNVTLEELETQKIAGLEVGYATTQPTTSTAKNSIEELSAQDLRDWARDSNGNFTVPLNSTSPSGDLADYGD